MVGGPPGRGNEATWRAIEANRASYDSLRPSLGRTERQLRELEAALARAQTELRQLRNVVFAFETSTSWRLTSPLRGLIKSFQSLWPKNGIQDQIEPPVMPAAADDPIISYQDWIDNEERRACDVLLRPSDGRAPVVEPRLGLVLWTGQADGTAIAGMLAATLAHVPASCWVLALCPAAVVAVAEGATAAASRPDIIVEAHQGCSGVVAMALDRLEVDYLCFHDLRDQIAPQALAMVGAVLAEQPQTNLLFADEDWIDPAGQRSQPFFKPDWDPELQRGLDLVGPFGFYRTDLVREFAGSIQPSPAWRYDLASRIAAVSIPERIRHVPAVLCHRAAPSPVGHAASMRGHAADRMRERGIVVQVHPVPGHEEWQRPVYALPQPEPLVSIIVPTRDRPDLLRTCTDGVLNRTEYRRIELLIVDNGTKDAEALALLDALSDDSRVRVLRQPGPFNWSALNNHAAAEATGEVLLLLNNDIAVLRPDWLAVLVTHALQPDVGAVGAKLLYPDGRVQHAGLATDLHGVPRHLFRFAAADDPGPSGLMALARSVWSVTGACLAIRRDLFVEVGGLNEGLPVAYNDVELCLRLTAQGYRIVWTPAAVLEHRELASRPPDHLGPRREQVREELNRLHRDWGQLALYDPYVNFNFDLTEQDVVLHRSPPGARERST